MSVFRQQSVKWAGEEYTFVPTLAFLEGLEAIRIGGERLNLLRLSGELQIGNARATDVTRVFHVMLREAMGREAPTKEEIYNAVTSGRDAEYMHNSMAFIQCVLPSIDFGKKQEAPASETKKPTRRKARSKSTGKAST